MISDSREGSLPSSFANRYFDCQKTKRAGFKPPREAARSFNSREFCFEIWERESAPADYCLIRRLSMDVSCPSLPPKTLVAETFKPNEQTSVYMAALGCHFIVCFRFVMFFSIEVFLSQRAISVSRELSCIKYQWRSCQELLEKISTNSISGGFDFTRGKRVAFE